MTWLTVHVGDCRDVLPTLPAESVHCVVTSPPYWGLRDYGVTGQLGLEATPEEYVANLVAVFREVRRVLRDDGTVWLNLGDSYAGGPSGPQGKNGQRASRTFTASTIEKSAGLAQKQLVGIPWRVAFALQADGWYLRSEIVWSKPNPMPESVTDRPTKSHEQVFLLSKKPRYYYDSDAVRENVYDLSGDPAAIGVPRQEEPTRGFVSMPLVFGETDDGVASEAGSHGETAGSEPTLASIATGTRGQGEAGWLAAQAGPDGGLSAVGGWQAGGTSSAGVSSRTSTPSAVLPQAPDVDGWPIHANGSGMGGHPSRPGVPLPVLRRAPTSDDGPRDPGQPGRDAHDGQRGRGVPSMQRAEEGPATGRNLRSVWSIATQPWKGAHFAVFPEALVEPCVKAGTSERGVCPECGAPWERVVEREGIERYVTAKSADKVAAGLRTQFSGARPGTPSSPTITTTGWRPSCAHDADPIPATVLDPFGGSGTVGRVANRLSRRAVLIELNPEYGKQIAERNLQAPLGLTG